MFVVVAAFSLPVLNTRLLPNIFPRHRPARSDLSSVRTISSMYRCTQTDHCGLNNRPRVYVYRIRQHQTKGSCFVLGHGGIYPIFEQLTTLCFASKECALPLTLPLLARHCPMAQKLVTPIIHRGSQDWHYLLPD